MRLLRVRVVFLVSAALTSELTAAGLPRVFTVSPQSLTQIKAQVQGGNASLKPAVAKLRHESDKALKAGPFSVMDKSLVPPSGDKHDYISFAPYFWPDPSKPDGKPYIRRDGEVNRDSRDQGDAGALGRMGSSVESLALAYYLTDDAHCADHAAKLLRAWFLDPATRMNPNLNFGQGVQGTTTGRGTGIIDTRGLIDVCDAAGLLETYPGWTSADRAGLAAWFKDYVHWLQTSKLGTDEGKAHNNHGSWYDAQVATMALYYGDRDLAKQVVEGAKRRIDTQIKPDGSQPAELARTKSFGYSMYNLRALMTIASLGDRVGIDLWHYRSPNGGSIQAALDYLAEYADPEKKWPHKELHFDRTALIPVLIQAEAAYGRAPYGKLLVLFTSDEVATNRERLRYPK